MQIFIAVASTFLSCGLIFAAGWFGIQANKRREERVKQIAGLSEAAKALIEAGVAFKNVPGLIEGLLKIAKAQTVEVVKLRISIDRMTKVVTRPEEKVNALEQPTEEDSSRAWDIAQLLIENPGMSPEVAAQKIKDTWDAGMTRVGSFME